MYMYMYSKATRIVLGKYIFTGAELSMLVIVRIKERLNMEVSHIQCGSDLAVNGRRVERKDRISCTTVGIAHIKAVVKEFTTREVVGS